MEPLCCRVSPSYPKVVPVTASFAIYGSKPVPSHATVPPDRTDRERNFGQNRLAGLPRFTENDLVDPPFAHREIASLVVWTN